MQCPVCALGNEILFGEHFQGVGDDVKQSQSAKAQDFGAIGSNAILHDGALLALDPGEHRREKADGNAQDEQYFCQRDQ